MTGKIGPGSRVRVVQSYRAPYPDPISVQAGDEVAVDAGRVSEWDGWIWCTSRQGKSGWVPTSYLEQRGDTGILRSDYDAIELTICEGETLTVDKTESGFLWVTKKDGRSGWVPAEHVEPSSCL